jgi:enoyl-CoA hydratase/carnithine racemase
LMPDTEAVTIERLGGIEVLRLNRPHALNAINRDVLAQLTTAFKRIRSDAEIRCVVLTGAPRPDGRGCFSAGDDLKEAAAGEAPPGNPGMKLCTVIDDLLVPSIAVIDGVCTTGALEIAMSCDLRIVAESAEISDWHLRRLGSGLGGWGASTRLSRLVGVAQAKDIILTGKVIDGREALRIGLAQRCVPTERLWEEAMEAAAAIAGMRPAGVRETMAHLSKVEELSKDASMRFAAQIRTWFGTTPAFEDAAGDALRARAAGAADRY